MHLKVVASISFVIWAFLVYAVEGQTFDFDCRRTGVSCGAGATCDLETKQCNCPTSDNINYVCQNLTANCDADHYGDDCALDRVQVNCQADKMFVNIYPHGTFEGEIYVYGLQGTNDCTFKDRDPGVTQDTYIENSAVLEGKQLELLHLNAVCGDAVETQDSNNGSTTYSRNFFIQYNNAFLTAVDQRLTATCIIAQSGSQVSSEVSAVNNNGRNYNNVSVDGNVNVVEFQLQTATGSPLPEQITLGDEIKLVFTLTEGNGFTNFRLDKCTANNTATGADLMSIEFLTDSCPSTAGTALFLNTPVQIRGPPATITLSITAFMFRGASSSVSFLCDVTLCNSAEADNCNMPTCSGVSTSTNTNNNNNDTDTNTGGTDNNNNNDTDTNTGGTDNNNNDTDTNTGGTDDNNNSTADTTGDDNGNNTDNSTTPDPNNSRRRKRREAETAAQAQVSTQVRVVDPNAPKTPENRVEREEVDCMLESEILALIIVLAVAVVVLMLIVIVCAYQQKTRQWKEASPRPEPSHHQPPTQTFSMPRLELTPSAKGYPPAV